MADVVSHPGQERLLSSQAEMLANELKNLGQEMTRARARGDKLWMLGIREKAKAKRDALFAITLKLAGIEDDQMRQVAREQFGKTGVPEFRCGETFVVKGVPCRLHEVTDKFLVLKPLTPEVLPQAETKEGSSNENQSP